eukprot:TRINITY_DN6232_c0_g1_i1.p1 TRINITY_DN6232_c0_g1~~TRINITY_DN6232_c0_g1_i1.p1  ORF type:complete len:570 (+),score=54.42 TRINITY_DN6232_c0_g1_i1:59-1768(+)
MAGKHLTTPMLSSNMLAGVVGPQFSPGRSGTNFPQGEDATSASSSSSSCADWPFHKGYSNISTRGVSAQDDPEWSRESSQQDDHEEDERPNLLKRGFSDVPSEWQGKSSVMIRNIAYRCFEQSLRELLCKSGYEGLFDYLYVPMNPERGSSRGYAFVNFLDAPTAYAFKQRFHGHSSDIARTAKRLEIIPANLQGQAQNAAHYVGKKEEFSEHDEFTRAELPEDVHAYVPIEWQGKTSVMIRNIKYSCFEPMLQEELHKAGFEGLFDYVYIPMNVERGSSRGYAFVNFLDADTAYAFKEKFHGRRSDSLGLAKQLEVIPANLQGYCQNVCHYVEKQNEPSPSDMPLQVNVPRFTVSLSAAIQDPQLSQYSDYMEMSGGFQQHYERKAEDGEWWDCAAGAEWQGKTSVMIRNIAYNCFEQSLRDALHKAGFEKRFDYIFVPVNAERGSSKGYAFVNFLDAATAYEFKRKFHGCRSDISGASKRLEIRPANLQGHAQNASHFAVTASQPQLVRANVNPKQPIGSTGQHRDHPAKVVLAPRPEMTQTYLSCYHCQNSVLSNSRFCHWCGNTL